MILDENGGPWLADDIHHNADGNHQHPLVVVNRQTGEVTYTGGFYYLAHFSKFVRPGAVRLSVIGGQPGLRCLAFRGTDNKYVAEFLNSKKETAEIKLDCEGRVLALKLLPFSISTAVWKE